VLEFYEEYFGQKFPLQKCDHVALPDFSSGAMENWGLITYRETALLAGEKSAISAKKYVALVIAHETAHQWFGNLVTMKWWDELWLNESFATMMEYLAVDALEPSWNMWEEFAVNEAVLSLRRDAIDGVQSVHIPVHHPDEISTIFDGAIVYAKGARLMNMLREYVGDEAFRQGLRDYFEQFAYQNTTGEDLWACLAQASGENVAEFMNAWLEQPGYPVVSAEKVGDELKLVQQQFFVGEGEEKRRIWPIPLGSNQADLPQTMNQRELYAPLAGDFVQLNQGNIAHFITNYSPELFGELLVQIPNLDTISRLQILQERSLLARGGQARSAEILRALAKYQNEQALNVWDMMNIAIGDAKIFVDEGTEAECQMKRFVGDLAQNQFDRLGFWAKDGENEEDTQMRSSILAHTIYAENQTAVQTALEIFAENQNWSEINAEIRALVLQTKVRHDESPELIERILAEYRTTPNVDYRNDLMLALTSTKNPETVAKLLAKMINPQTVRPQDLISWFIYLLRNSHGREQTWRWLRDNWNWIEETFAGDKNYNDFPRYAGAILRTEQHLAEFVEFFAPLKNEPSLTRAVEMGEREIRARVELIARDKAGVEEFLAQYCA
jgi:aminopeptidase N